MFQMRIEPELWLIPGMRAYVCTTDNTTEMEYFAILIAKNKQPHRVVRETAWNTREPSVNPLC